MALPKQLQAGMTPDEYTFLAEEQLIDIVPNVAISRIRLLSGMYGPFRPPTKATVPLWLALSLKRKRKCRIVPPSWLNAETLQLFLDDERGDQDSFKQLPRHFYEVCKILLDVAPDDITSPSQIRSLLKDIRETRQAKIRVGLQMEGTMRGSYLQVTYLTQIELCEIRPFLRKAMGMMQALEKQDDE